METTSGTWMSTVPLCLLVSMGFLPSSITSSGMTQSWKQLHISLPHHQEPRIRCIFNGIPSPHGLHHVHGVFLSAGFSPSPWDWHEPPVRSTLQHFIPPSCFYPSQNTVLILIQSSSLCSSPHTYSFSKFPPVNQVINHVISFHPSQFLSQIYPAFRNSIFLYYSMFKNCQSCSDIYSLN